MMDDAHPLTFDMCYALFRLVGSVKVYVCDDLRKTFSRQVSVLCRKYAMMIIGVSEVVCYNCLKKKFSIKNRIRRMHKRIVRVRSRVRVRVRMSRSK